MTNIAVLGLDPDVPAGTLTLRPAELPARGALSVNGLRLAGHRLDVALHRDGSIASVTTEAPVTVLQP